MHICIYMYMYIYKYDYIMKKKRIIKGSPPPSYVVVLFMKLLGIEAASDHVCLYSS